MNTLKLLRSLHGLGVGGSTQCLLRRNFSLNSVQMAKITHVIFDFDGVILDTETIFYAANKQVMKSYGVEYTMDLKLGQMGRRLDEGTKWLLDETCLSKRVSVKDYIAKYDEILDKLLDNPSELPGAKKIIDHLHRTKVPMAICTGSASDEFRLKTRKCKHLVDQFPVIVLAGDDPEVKHGKPAPDPYLITMRRMNPVPKDPKSVLVFEDSVNGVLSALAANNTVIWIPQEQFKPKDFDRIETELKPKVAEILPSLELFNPAKYGLPPF